MISKEKSGVYLLGGVYTIENAKTFLADLKKIKSKADVVFNIEKLEAFDASFIQLLLSFQATLHKKNAKLLFQGKFPEEFLSSYKVCGFLDNPAEYENGIELLNTSEI